MAFRLARYSGSCHLRRKLSEIRSRAYQDRVAVACGGGALKWAVEVVRLAGEVELIAVVGVRGVGGRLGVALRAGPKLWMISVL